MGSTDSSANETSDTEIDERQKVNRRKTQKVEYKPDYETGKINVGFISIRPPRTKSAVQNFRSGHQMDSVGG